MTTLPPDNVLAGIIGITATVVVTIVFLLSIRRLKRHRDQRSATELLIGLAFLAIGASYLVASLTFLGVLEAAQRTQDLITTVNTAARTVVVLVGIVVIRRWWRVED